jgi:uroporphyrinogen-III synthase
MSFAGMNVLSLESRRAAEMAQLIRNREGEPFVAPSMREAPLEHSEEALQFAERLFAGAFDMVILLTGVGTRLLNKLLTPRYGEGRFADALRRVAVVPRGPKPIAVLREWGVPWAVTVPEPNTWRELVAAIDGRPERRIAVQEYGKPNPELIAALQEHGAEVTVIRVYGWDLPEDTQPLREAVKRLAAGQFQVALFTTSIQIAHLFRIAAEEGVEEPLRKQLSELVIGSIGPTTSEALEEYGLHADFEPTHPKMGFLVQELAERAAGLLQSKR